MKSGTSKDAADKLVKNIRRKTRQTHSAEEKIRIVLAGLRDIIGFPSNSEHPDVLHRIRIIDLSYVETGPWLTIICRIPQS